MQQLLMWETKTILCLIRAKCSIASIWDWAHGISKERLGRIVACAACLKYGFAIYFKILKKIYYDRLKQKLNSSETSYDKVER
jgi:hypothetical protein